VRIFYDHQVTSLQDAGGVSRYFFELIRQLLSHGGIEPDLLLGLQHSVIPFRSLPKPARVFAVSSGLLPGNQRYAINEAMTALLAPTRGRYDVYHATYQRVLPYVRSRAVVVTHHDSITERYPHLFPDAAAIHGRLKRLYARADRIVCISEASRQDLLHFHTVPLEKTEVIHHGFSPLPEPVETELTDFDGRPFLLYVGARSAYKNFSLVVEALAGQRDKALCLLVMGGGAFSSEEAQHIEQCGVTSRVRLVPRASDGELAAAYRAACLFLYPSLYEGFGFPPLEAMHSGCPAIVSRIPALLEICGDAAFYFDPETAELVSLIESLRSDDTFRFSKKEAGFAQVARYTWEQAATLTLAAYRRALA
jgi:glycosyltransferase involved in cell wall biosynthesis